MSQDLTEPTITNPFAEPERTFRQNKKQAVAKATRPTTKTAVEPKAHRNFGEDLTEPSIANPFIEQKRSFRSAKREELPIGVRANIIPRRDDVLFDVANYDAGFYLSQATRRFIKSEVEKGSVLEANLPVVFEFSASIAKTFNRSVPSMSDIEVAVKIGDLDRAKDIAAGNQQLDILRRESTTGEIMPQAKRVQMWKRVAQILVEDYEKKHTAA